MKKILLYSPNYLDGVSYYRQWGPMSALHDRYQTTQFSNQMHEYTHWTWFLNYDICLFSRPHRGIDLLFARQCVKFGLPIWFDYDDALLHMTEDNPTHGLFGGQEAKQVITECLKLATVVTVCSEVQKTWLLTNLSLKNVLVIPNAMDHRLLKFAAPFKGNKRGIAWRGNESHINDLLTYQKPLRELMKENEERDWCFFGLNPFILQSDCKNQQWIRPMNLIDFIVEFCKFNPSIVFVPLAENFFNQVKSHLAWFDATLAGGVCFAPNFENWRFPGVELYEPSNFKREFSNLLQYSHFELKKIHQTSFEFIKDNLLLSKINELRIELIENL